MPKKNDNKKITKIDKRKFNIGTTNKGNIINYQKIEFNDYIIKDIYPDGNCFYRSISYFYRDTEEDYSEQSG